MAIPWTTLRYEHTEAVWLLLADRYDSSTGDLYLTVLRGVLRTAWQRGHLSTNDYLRAADLTPIGRGQLWKGRNAALGIEFNPRIDLDLTQYARAQQGGRGGVRE
jgi:hypothetical protein